MHCISLPEEKIPRTANAASNETGFLWRRVAEADVLMATDALGPSNAPDDDGLETPHKILYSDLSTGVACCSEGSTAAPMVVYKHANLSPGIVQS